MMTNYAIREMADFHAIVEGGMPAAMKVGRRRFPDDPEMAKYSAGKLIEATNDYLATGTVCLHYGRITPREPTIELTSDQIREIDPLVRSDPRQVWTYFFCYNSSRARWGYAPDEPTASI